MISLLNTSTLTFSRPSSGDSYDDDGNAVEVTSNTFTAKGSLQPVNGGKLRSVLPEGVTASSGFVFYTKTLIRTVDQFTKLDSDTACINGRTFISFSTGDWSNFSLVPTHYKIVLIREDQAVGI